MTAWPTFSAYGVK